MSKTNPLMLHAIMQVLADSADNFGVSRRHAESILNRWKENELT